MMHKIAVIGDKDVVLPFKIIGFDSFDCQTAQDARQLIDRLAREDYGIIYVTERLATMMPETLARYRGISVPIVIVIPDDKGSLGLGLQAIQDNVEKAIGQNILS